LVTLSNSTVSANYASGSGGGVYTTYSTVTLTNTGLYGNSAQKGGGLYAKRETSLTLTYSTVSGNSASIAAGGFGGGGLYVGNSSSLMASYSTVSDNIARYGGGVRVLLNSSLTLTASTISNNSASGNGGGVYSNSPVTLTNSTVYRNSAQSIGGVGVSGAGTSKLTLTNSTVSGNSAALSEGGLYAPIVKLYNTILANNSGGDCVAWSSGYATYSLITDSSNNCGAVNGANHNKVGSSYDPLLGPLQFNGGSTRTLMPAPGSPAIDAGGGFGDFCPAKDQRGVSRPQGSLCDIGSVERQSTEDYIFNNGFDPD